MSMLRIEKIENIGWKKKLNFSIFRKIDLIDFFDSIDSPIVEYIIEQFLLTSCLYHNNWF